MDDPATTESAKLAGLDMVCQLFPGEMAAAIDNARNSRAALGTLDEVGIGPWSPVAIADGAMR